MKLNPDRKVTLHRIGNEGSLVVVIDDLLLMPERIVTLASDHQESDYFKRDDKDYYPGIRKASPQSYRDAVCTVLRSLASSICDYQSSDKLTLLMSAYSIATTLPEHLRPIQMLPHFDSVDQNQLAIVHYFCDEKHGGTSWYRHISTHYERINDDRLSHYRQVIKQQAVAEQIHLNPRYINGDTELFERLFSVKAKYNRAVIYPSNLLHSGDICPDNGLSSIPDKGRLTVSSFIKVSQAT